jgi:hypothetical protein
MPDPLSAADIAEGHRLEAALVSAPWFPYLNDLIGGYCVMSVDKWPSEAGAGGVVADFINTETAEAIAWMRNHLPALLDAAEKAARLEATIAEFINQRVEYVNACRNANADHDYYRWQGGAEARRQLAQRLGWTVPYESGDKTTPKPEETDSDAQ